jgi:hypothetical protein
MNTQSAVFYTQTGGPKCHAGTLISIPTYSVINPPHPKGDLVVGLSGYHQHLRAYRQVLR